MNAPDANALAAQGDITGLTDAIPERLAKQTPNYDVEYGIREDDKAMIFHFYPPGTDWSKYPPEELGKWADDYRMHERLEAALPRCFKVDFVKAVFTAETQSFCIIVKGLGRSPDPFFYVHRFFEMIDSGLL
jgi:hypothetical protein